MDRWRSDCKSVRLSNRQSPHATCIDIIDGIRPWQLFMDQSICTVFFFFSPEISGLPARVPLPRVHELLEPRLHVSILFYFAHGVMDPLVWSILSTPFAQVAKRCRQAIPRRMDSSHLGPDFAGWRHGACNINIDLTLVSVSPAFRGMPFPRQVNCYSSSR